MPVRGLKVVTAAPTVSFRPDMGHGTGIYARLTLSGASISVTLPATAKIGQLLVFEFLQDGTGGRALVYATGYKAGTADVGTFTASGNTLGKIATDTFVVSAGGAYSAPVLRRIAAPVAWA